MTSSLSSRNSETARLADLQQYQILDTPAESAFDELTQLAAQICQTPIALISLIDTDRQWFKSKVGLTVSETHRKLAFCAHAIQQDAPLVIENALEDERFATNALVTGAPHIRFYAGAPLTTPTGQRIGTLCVIDQVPRQLQAEQLSALQALSRQVISQLELRRSLTALQQSEERLQFVLQNMPVMLDAVDVEGNITLWNQECERVTGYRGDEMVGNADALARLYPNATDRQQMLMDLATRRDSYRNWEWELTCKDGTVKTIARSNLSAHFPLPGWASWGTGVDITEQKQAEKALRQQTQRERLVTGIANRIRQSLDLDEILNVTVAEVQQLLQADRVLTYRVDPEGTGTIVTEAVAPGHPAILEQSLPGEIFPLECYDRYQKGRIRTVTDVEQDVMSPCLADTLRQLGVKSKLVVPILHEENLWGLLIAHQCSQPRQWQTWEAELLQQLATQVAIAIHQASLYQQVQVELGERKRAEQKISDQAALLDITTDAILVKDLNDQIVYWNNGAARLYGWSAAEVSGRSVKNLLYRQLPHNITDLKQTVLHKGEWQGELHHCTKDGREIIVESRWTLVRDSSEQANAVLMVNTDITQKKQLEQQFLRAQRLESIGTLAGGIAHDLNNVLSPILMAVPLLERKMSNPQSQQWLDIIDGSARRGASLVKQVLLFARGVEGERSPIEVKHLIWEIKQIAEETFPKSITLSTNLPRDLWLVNSDATQLHQILMNLCLNARDAMPYGGMLKIMAQNVELEEGAAQIHIDAQNGPYVVLAVLDTGIGIPSDVVDRLFDPFFTTKEIGKGTGLGLATVMSIVKSHGGFITVASYVGEGTTFKVYLPAVRDHAIQAVETLEMPVGAGEWILVADDEAAIRQITKTTLETYGYRVMTACNGIEAIALYAQHKTEIGLAVIDLMMPSLDGANTIRTLRAMNPQVKIVASSGLSSGDQLAAIDVKAQHFLLKPYTAQELLTTLHQILV